MGGVVAAQVALRCCSRNVARQLHGAAGSANHAAYATVLALEPPDASGSDQHAEPRAIEDCEHRGTAQLAPLRFLRWVPVFHSHVRAERCGGWTSACVSAS